MKRNTGGRTFYDSELLFVGANRNKKTAIVNKAGMPTGNLLVQPAFGPAKTMSIKKYTNEKKSIKNYVNRRRNQKKFNSRGMFNMYEVTTPNKPPSTPTYLPNYAAMAPQSTPSQSPSYNVPVVKIPNNAPIPNKLRNIDLCMPRDFLYREFRSGKNGYFNFIMSNNKNGFANVKLPTKNGPVQPGLSIIGSGAEAVSFVGCIDNKCKEKVAIKVGIALKSTNKSPIKKNYKSAPGVAEFKIQKDVYEKCKDETPHVVAPYEFTICTPEKTFVSIRNNKLKRALGEATAGVNVVPGSDRLVVAYYEFFNGGDLMTWMARHANTLTELDLKVILFQIIWTLDVLYRKIPGFRHNDIHLQNIFVKTGKDVDKTGFTKYGDFTVPNRGVFTALGDFGWAGSNNRPNPRVASGLWAAAGFTKNKTQRQDLHFFMIALLVSVPPKFKKAREFVKGFVTNAPNLLMRESATIKQNRLIANNKRIKSTGQLLASEYFKDFIKPRSPTKSLANSPVKSLANSPVKSLAKSPVKSLAKSPARPPVRPVKNKGRAEKNIINNIKKMVANSSGCGARATKGKNGIQGMSVSAMKQFIMLEGTDAARAAVRGVTKRKDVCNIIRSFRKGKILLGITMNSPQNKVETPKARPVANNNNGLRAYQMTVPELENFIMNKGTDEAIAKLANNPKRSGLVRIMRSFAKGRAKSGVQAQRGGRVTKSPNFINVARTGGANNATARVRQVRRAPALGPRSPLSRSEKRFVSLLRNRLYTRAGANNNNSMSNAYQNALRKFRNLKKAGLISANNIANARATINTLVPRAVKSPKPSGPAVRMMAIRKNAPVTATAAAINSKVDMYRYEMNGSLKSRKDIVNKFAIQGKLCKSYSRPQIDRILVRVGVNPKSVKSIADACIAIASKRMKQIKPKRSAKQMETNRNAIMAQAKKEYNLRLNAIGNRVQAAKKASSSANKRQINAGASQGRFGKVVPTKKVPLGKLLNRLSAKTGNQ